MLPMRTLPPWPPPPRSSLPGHPMRIFPPLLQPRLYGPCHLHQHLSPMFKRKGRSVAPDRHRQWGVRTLDHRGDLLASPWSAEGAQDPCPSEPSEIPPLCDSHRRCPVPSTRLPFRPSPRTTLPPTVAQRVSRPMRHAWRLPRPTRPTAEDPA